ncbi:Chaperone protein dnaJ 49 [Nymphaea thermarum]|nr:Chaperone protein dnaJ 49 [Nymphaea thermarum]
MGFHPTLNADAEERTTEEEEGESKAHAEKARSIAERKFNGCSLKSALRHARRAEKLCPQLPGIAQLVTTFRVHLAASATIAGDPDWYAILQVNPFSPLDAIKSQYRKLAFILHPDKNKCLGSEEAFKLVGQAWSVLSERNRRRIYDLKRRIELEFQTTHELSQPVDTFWTACTTCRLLHEFERKYIGRKLVCPNCKKDFTAEEFQSREENAGSQGRKKPKGGDGLRGKNTSSSNFDSLTHRQSAKSSLGSDKHDLGVKFDWSNVRRSVRAKRKRKRGLDEGQFAGSNGTRPKTGRHGCDDGGKPDSKLVAMRVEDSDFYDFDQDRTERSFKKGQVWAVYDDDDGMPRHYGLIDEVVSLDPFRLQMSWLDLQNNGDKTLVCWESYGFHVTCGHFKVAKKTDVESVNIFSHVVDCERIAKEIYLVYPVKGSVWALYSDATLDRDENSSPEDRRGYDIVVFLTNFTEVHGLSMAYLERAEGFKTVFKRREIGPHAIQFLGKDEIQRISHQIPARKLSGTEHSALPKESCWELDPASVSVV